MWQGSGLMAQMEGHQSPMLIHPRCVYGTYAHVCVQGPTVAGAWDLRYLIQIR